MGLLHDDPQPAYSHLTGIVEKGLTGKDHDDRFVESIKNHYEESLVKCGFSIDDVRNVKESNKAETIWSKIGADKIDYIPRDLFHIGLTPPDINPLLMHLVFLNSRGLCVEERHVNSAFSFIQTYYTIHKEVY